MHFLDRERPIRFRLYGSKWLLNNPELNLADLFTRDWSDVRNLPAYAGEGFYEGDHKDHEQRQVD